MRRRGQAAAETPERRETFDSMAQLYALFAAMPYANDDDCSLGLDDVSEDISASAERDELFSTVRFVPHRAPEERIGAQKVRALQNRRRPRAAAFGFLPTRIRAI